jgi:hypothetical protein
MERQTEHAPEHVIALYHGLAETQAAMEELEQAGVPYPDIRMGAHTSADAELPAIDAGELPAQFWSLQVVVLERGVYGAEDILRKHQPIAVGRLRAPNAGRSDTDLGALAWRHYVFETSHATDWVGDTAGTTGATGIGSSGVFAEGTLAEGNPPVRGLPGSHDRPASEQQQPSSDERTPEISTERSRPDNTLKE